MECSRAALALSLSAAALCACGGTPPAPAHLAVAVPLSGELARDGRGIERAVELAVADETAKGLPAPVQVVAFDDGGQDQAAADAARQAAADPAVFAVIGHLTSGCSLTASRVYAEAGLAMITPSATAPEVTQQQELPEWAGPRVVFRLPPSDAIQGGYAAQFARQLGLSRVFVVDDHTTYGQSLASEFERGFQARGGKIAGRESVARGQTDFAPLVGRVAAASADGLFYGGVYAEAGELLRQARADGLKAAFFSGDGAKTDDIFRIAGAASDGAYFTVSGVPVEDLPSASDFVARYKARYDGQAPRTYDDYGYVAAELALEAFRKAGPSRAKVLEALRATDADTMLGVVRFDGKGDTLKSTITMTRANFGEKRFDTVY